MSEESLKMEDGEELNLDTTSIENLTDTGECPSFFYDELDIVLILGKT